MNIFEEVSALEFLKNNNTCYSHVTKLQTQLENLVKFKNLRTAQINDIEFDGNSPRYDYKDSVVADLMKFPVDRLFYIEIEEIDYRIARLKEEMSNWMSNPKYISLKKIESYKEKALLGGTIEDSKEAKRHLYETKRELNSFLFIDPTMRNILGNIISDCIESKNIEFTPDYDKFDETINNLVQNNKISKEEASLYELLNNLSSLDSSLITESLKRNQSLELEKINELELEDEITQAEARNRRKEVFKKYNNLKLERMNSYNNLSINQSKSSQADSMIDAMVNGTMDVNGQPINNMNNNMNTRTMGFTAPMLIGLITGICMMALVIVGIMLTS